MRSSHDDEVRYNEYRNRAQESIQRVNKNTDWVPLQTAIDELNKIPEQHRNVEDQRKLASYYFLLVSFEVKPIFSYENSRDTNKRKLGYSENAINELEKIHPLSDPDYDNLFRYTRELAFMHMSLRQNEDAAKAYKHLCDMLITNAKLDKLASYLSESFIDDEKKIIFASLAELGDRMRDQGENQKAIIFYQLSLDILHLYSYEKELIVKIEEIHEAMMKIYDINHNQFKMAECLQNIVNKIYLEKIEAKSQGLSAEERETCFSYYMRAISLLEDLEDNDDLNRLRSTLCYKAAKLLDVDNAATTCQLLLKSFQFLDKVSCKSKEDFEHSDKIFNLLDSSSWCIEKHVRRRENVQEMQALLDQFRDNKPAVKPEKQQVLKRDSSKRKSSGVVENSVFKKVSPANENGTMHSLSEFRKC